VDVIDRIATGRMLKRSTSVDDGTHEAVVYAEEKLKPG
jgi:hypothetical protein